MGLEMDYDKAEKQTPTEQPLLQQIGVETPAFIDDSQDFLKSRLHTIQSGRKTRGLLFQIFTSLVANLMGFTDGMVVAWTAPMIPYFLSEKSHIKMSESAAEWLEHSFLLGCVTGLPGTIYAVEKLGRKKAILLDCSVMAVAWAVIAVANRVEYLYASRFVIGMCLNMAYVAAPMYCAEISNKKIRGFMSINILLMMLGGIIAMYSLGPFVAYYIPPVMACCILCVEVLVFSFLPESPYYLLLHNNHDQAMKSLKFFRSSGSIETELNEINKAIEVQKSCKIRPQDLFLVKSNRNSLFLLVIINAAQLLGGLDVTVMNMHEILEDAGSTYIKPSTAAILFAVCMFLAAVVASVTVDRVGRKILLVTSSIMSGLCMLFLAIYFNLKNAGYTDLNSVSWMPIASLLVYAAAFKLGLGVVPIVIIAELFPSEIKSVGMTMADSTYVIMGLIALQVFHKLKVFGMHVPFYIFASTLLLNSLFVVFCLPETKGKTLNEIQAMLKGEKPSRPKINGASEE